MPTALQCTLDKTAIFCFAEFMAKTEHCEVIRKNYYELIDKMDLQSCGTLELLFSLGVIDNREKDSITSECTNHGKNEALLSLLSRKSFVLFQTFVQALDATGQSHLANIVRVQQG